VQGTPWSNLEALWRQSPLRNVANVTTPVLIVHAEADHRCPIEQAEQWFVALQRIGAVDTRLVRFPEESHELSRSGRPDRRIRRLDEIVAWFEDHA
jgi:dipeptidyl aminopeptidase/acylaminoacyl peptidase